VTVLRALLSLAVLFYALGSVGTSQILKQADLQKVYGKRWLPLPLPDSRVGPGAIVTIKKGEVAWESSLDRCGAPPVVLKPVPGSDSSINATTEAEYGADAALKIAGVSIGPEFSKVKKTSLKLEEHHPEALDRIRLGEWFHKAGTELSAECQKFLAEKDVFIVQESYKAGKGRVTLYDQKGAKLSVGGLNVGIVKLDANAHGTKTVDGAIEFDNPMWTAIRRLKYFKGGDLRSLGAPGPEKTVDAAARALLYPPAARRR
jgi:hypothetical protein